MRRYGRCLAASLVTGTALVLAWRESGPTSSERPFEPALRVVEPAPMCPWRDPQADLASFFPEATGHHRATVILSGQRLELERRLGRAPRAEENALYVHQISQDGVQIGSVLTERVKGENGAIEVVLAVGRRNTVRGLRLQRLREPALIAEAIQNPSWLAAFRGKDALAEWKLGRDLPALPKEAQTSGQAIAEGVRSLLILLSVAEGSSGKPQHH